MDILPFLQQMPQYERRNQSKPMIETQTLSQKYIGCIRGFILEAPSQTNFPETKSSSFWDDKQSSTQKNSLKSP